MRKSDYLVPCTGRGFQEDRKLAVAFARQWAKEQEAMDKAVYIERHWIPCSLVSQQGTTVTVKVKGVTKCVPYQLVRDVDASCRCCDVVLYDFDLSYQGHDGSSTCKRCYHKYDQEQVQLLFGGHQWLSWGGQVAIRDMEDGHLVNAIGMLKKRANDAADLTGASMAEYLDPMFPHLVDELRRRRPNDEQVKVNSYWLYIWTVIFTIMGRR